MLVNPLMQISDWFAKPYQSKEKFLKKNKQDNKDRDNVESVGSISFCDILQLKTKENKEKQ